MARSAYGRYDPLRRSLTITGLNSKLLPSKRITKTKAKSEVLHGKLKSKIEKKREQAEKLAKLRKSDWDTINSQIGKIKSASATAAATADTNEAEEEVVEQPEETKRSHYEVLENDVEA